MLPAPARVSTWTRPPQAFDGLADRIHAHAPPRQVGDVGGRREPRHENKVDDGVFAHVGDRVGGGQSTLDRRPANPVGVDATTIVLNLDNDMFALAARAQTDCGDRGFPCGRPLGARLNAVIHRVAHDMEQRLEQHLDDRLVGLGLLALDDQPHRLRQQFRHFSHKAREPLEHAAQRKDSQFQHGSLQPVDEAVELAIFIGE